MSSDDLPSLVRAMYAIPPRCLIPVPLLFMIAAVSSHAADDKSPPSKTQRAHEVRLPAQEVSFPIFIVNGFPFVAGSIAGTPGKLMLDTGNEQALAINDHRVPFSGSRSIGSGLFGSGQTFVVRLLPEVRDIRIGTLSFPIATLVGAQDARQLESITPDFIGWFGYSAWANRALKLDYRRSRVTFYPDGPGVYLAGEHVRAALPFETRKLPNHPVMAARIGTTDVVTAWDTGQYGTLYTSEAGKRCLIDEGRLTASRTEPDAFDLHGFTIGDHVMPDITGIDVETTAFAAASPIGLTERNILTIGYGFLREYKTIWDFRTKRIYLLDR